MNAAYVIVALPLAGFLLLLWLGRRLGEPRGGWLATLMSAGSFVASLVTFFSLLGRDAASRSVIKQVYTWVPVGAFRVNVALQLDPLSVTMALFVTGVASLIHLYAIGYMHGDREFPRFFMLMNLFLFSMLCLVLADNFLFSFLGWEGVGFCSYQLVSFWFDRNRAAVAGKKAFVTNRVGDFGFMIGMFLIFNHFGSLEYRAVFGGLGATGALAEVTATGIALMLFLGAAGKSAQLPLYIWLPDAMEGPTPVSALIHAATMVTAGVYLMARIAPILHYAPSALTVIASVGAATALFAATIACAQDDIKKVLAYSTISQLGYMFLGIGAGAYVSGLFHMITHAFFKALLFLGAGSVIHGMHDEQDMKKMGALRKWMPVTFATFVIGWLAISGIFPFAGFWSKDDILASAWGSHGSVGKVLWAVGFLTAGLTAYYMSRQVALVFMGKARWQEARPPAEAHVPEGHVVEPHESPWTMATPLVILGFLALVGGVINLPWGKANFLTRWLEPVFPKQLAPEPHVDTAIKVILAVATVALCLAGIGLGLVPWLRSARHDALEPVVLRHAWYGDEAVAAFVAGPGTELADFTAYNVDQQTIDGAVNGVAWLVRHGGGVLRKLQTGYVRNYALGVAGGAAALLLYVVVRTGR
ncbi:MAG TPA: NADH-quinone oxidoreductase subunit L [Acidimicrobiales bacterium]|nr:NADH-quinone oxidoreductase subunit L [Acidimicrobiales bacterium]